MVQSAEYIYNKLKSEELLSLAHNSRPDLGTAKFPLVTTGHSLGAGTAALPGSKARGVGKKDML